MENQRDLGTSDMNECLCICVMRSSAGQIKSKFFFRNVLKQVLLRQNNLTIESKASTVCRVDFGARLSQ